MEGYAKIGERMATLPSLAIFRSFQALRAQNLLYLQAELSQLETRFRDQARADAASGIMIKKQFSRDWYTLSCPDDEGEQSEQWRLALDIRQKLEEYENTLLRYHQLSTSFRQPQRRDVEILAGNLDDPKLPDYLLGRDSSIWKDESLRYDLISIHTSHDFDIITKWLIEILLRSYHQLIGRRKKIRKCSNPNADADLFHYDDDRLEVPATVISTVLASLLPTLSIVVLYIVHNMPARLALVAALTTIFSVGVAVLTKARRVDIFAATAAFAAVQVVFIGTNVPGSSGNGKTS